METIRAYREADEDGWLRCRVLSFLYTPYFDDVLTAKPDHGLPTVSLVAADGDRIDGLIDITLDGGRAVIETVAVHPDHQGRGLGTRLLEAALPRLREAGAAVLEAWTRDGEGTLRWYRGRGFVESGHYLHVYAEGGEVARAVEPVAGTPVKVFLHAPLTDEASAREAYRRVHVCRCFRLALTG